MVLARGRKPSAAPGGAAHEDPLAAEHPAAYAALRMGAGALAHAASFMGGSAGDQMRGAGEGADGPAAVLSPQQRESLVRDLLQRIQGGGQTGGGRRSSSSTSGSGASSGASSEELQRLYLMLGPELARMGIEMPARKRGSGWDSSTGSGGNGSGIESGAEAGSLGGGVFGGGHAGVSAAFSGDRAESSGDTPASTGEHSSPAAAAGAPAPTAPRHSESVGRYPTRKPPLSPSHEHSGEVRAAQPHSSHRAPMRRVLSEPRAPAASSSTSSGVGVGVGTAASMKMKREAAPTQAHAWARRTAAACDDHHSESNDHHSPQPGASPLLGPSFSPLLEGEEDGG